MLSHLDIRNFLLISNSEIDWTPGLNVITGETGAGKSILLQAMSYVLGNRVEGDVVRPGADTASITISFSHIPSSIIERLQELDISIEEDILHLKRVLKKDKTSKMFVNDRPVSLSFVRGFAPLLIDIHGQFDALNSPDAYLDALDRFGNISLKAMKDALKIWRNDKDELKAFDTKLSRPEEQPDFLTYTIQELEKAKPQPNEMTNLQDERTRYAEGGKVQSLIQEALSTLEGPSGAVSQLNGLYRLAQRIAPYGATIFPLERVDQIRLDLEDMKEHLRDQHDLYDNAHTRLETIDSRLFQLKSLAQKFRGDPDHLHLRLQQTKESLRQHTQADEIRLELQAKCDRSRQHFLEEARRLSEKRKEVALRLQEMIQKELPPLKLEALQFSIGVTEVSESSWGEKGIDEVLFNVLSMAGGRPSPLHQTASGGERSRLLLTLKLALAESLQIPTLIFDEVDSGIGGATAAAVGERLQRLAENHQVVVITHSPQVAGHGKAHWHVQKQHDAASTLSKISQLSPDERVEEIARMLAGHDITTEARSAAQKLIKEPA